MASLAVVVFARQTPAPAGNPDDVVFRVTTTLVQVDAVVTDAKGKQVTDLSPSDFEVRVDGKLQPISKFSYIRLAPEATGVPKPPAKRSAGQPPIAPPPRLLREQVRSAILLVVDDLGLSFESTALVRGALKKFVNEQLEPDQVAAIYQTGRSSGIFQQFTSDKRLLLAAIERLRWNPLSRAGTDAIPVITRDTDTTAPYQKLFAQDDLEPTSAVQTQKPTEGMTASRQRFLQGDREAFGEDQSQNYTVGTLASLNEILKALHGLPGRKSLILFSDGIDLSPGLGSDDQQLTAAVRNLVEHANRSGTVIHAIDARGLQTLALTAADNPDLAGATPTPEGVQATLQNVRNNRSSDLLATQTGLEYIAKMTGGLAFLNNNDMNWALERVMEDQRGYYLLGFQPDSNTFRPKPGGNYHSIRVRLTRKGLNVRSRTGFFGTTDEAMQPSYATPGSQLRAALLSPFAATGIGVRVTPVYLNSTPKGPLVRNLVYLDPKDLSFATGPDGKRSASLQLLAVAAGADNRILGSADAMTLVAIPPEKFDQALRDGLLLVLEVQVKLPGAYQIRVALRDTASSKTGSAGQYLEIPNLKKGRLTLSSVLVDEAGEASESSRFLGIMPAKRQFHPGNQIEFFSILDNVRSTPRPGPASVEAQVRILRNGQTVFSGPAKLTAMEGGKEWAVRGKLQLTDAMPAGEYYLQVSAVEHVHKRNNWASTWTDFELTPE